MAICSIPDCNETFRVRRGLCNKHYLKFLRYRNPLDLSRKSPGEQNHCGKPTCPANKKLRNAVDYIRKENHYKNLAALWRQKNQEKYKQRIVDYLSREDVISRSRERTRKWVETNKELKKASDKKYRAKNRGKLNFYGSMHRSKKLQATPSWLTENDLRSIKSIYESAKSLKAYTNIQHDVDHIVPLNGRTVCGLHVPWNLRVLKREENNKRKRIWSWDLQDC